MISSENFVKTVTNSCPICTTLIMFSPRTRVDHIRSLESELDKFLKKTNKVSESYESILNTVLDNRHKLCLSGVEIKLPAKLTDSEQMELISKLEERFELEESNTSSSSQPIWNLYAKYTKVPRPQETSTAPSPKRRRTTRSRTALSLTTNTNTIASPSSSSASGAITGDVSVSESESEVETEPEPEPEQKENDDKYAWFQTYHGLNSRSGMTKRTAFEVMLILECMLRSELDDYTYPELVHGLPGEKITNMDNELSHRQKYNTMKLDCRKRGIEIPKKFHPGDNSEYLGMSYIVDRLIGTRTQAAKLFEKLCTTYKLSQEERDFMAFWVVKRKCKNSKAIVVPSMETTQSQNNVQKRQFIDFKGAGNRLNGFELLLGIEGYFRHGWKQDLRASSGVMKLYNQFQYGRTERVLISTKHAFQTVLKKFGRKNPPRYMKLRTEEYLDTPYVVQTLSGTNVRLLSCLETFFDVYQIPTRDRVLFHELVGIPSGVSFEEDDEEDEDDDDDEEEPESSQEEEEPVSEVEFLCEREPGTQKFTLSEHVIMFILMYTNQILSKDKTDKILEEFYMSEEDKYRKSFLDYRREFLTIKKLLMDKDIPFPRRWGATTSLPLDDMKFFTYCPMELTPKLATEHLSRFMDQCQVEVEEAIAIAHVLGVPPKQVCELAGIEQY